MNDKNMTEKEVLSAMDEGFTEVGGGDSYPVHEFNKEGDKIKGVYVSKRESVGPNDSMMYIIELGGGVKESVWGSTVLDDRMANVQIGDEVIIEFSGRQKPKNGGKAYKVFKVFRRQMPFSEVE